jgi:hypothetical protein
MRSRAAEFFLTLAKSLNPFFLKELGERKTKDAFSYFFSVMFILLFVMLIAAIPQMIKFPMYMNEQLFKFSSLSVNVTAGMNEPIIITQNNPQLIIDTTGNITTLTKGNILITNNSLIYRAFFQKKEINLSGNLLEQKQSVVKVIKLLVILAAPMLYSVLYVVSALKFLLIIFICAGITFIILKIIKNKTGFRHLLRIMLHASTIMMLIDLVCLPYAFYRYLLPMPVLFGISITLAPLAVFIVFFIIGITKQTHN